MKKLLAAFLVLCCTVVSALAQTAITLPIAANAIADLGNGPIKVRMVSGNASIFTSQGSGTGSTSGLSTTLTLTAAPTTPPIVGGLISGNGITSGTTVAAYDGIVTVTMSAAMTVPSSTTVSWGAACPSTPPSNVIQASPQVDYYMMYTQARVCAVSPGGPVNTLLIEPIFYDQTSQSGGGSGGFVGVGQGLVNNAGIISTAAGVDTNTLNTQVVPYTIAPSDCGGTVQAGTGSTGLFTVTLPSISGFDPKCTVRVVNGDAVNAKSLAGFPAPSHSKLYPGQAETVAIVNGVWVMTQAPGRFKVPGGTFNLYANQTSGNDANDGLTVSTPTQHILAVLDIILNDFDLTSYAGFSGEPSGPTLILIHEPAGICDTNGIHYSPHGSAVGAVGGAAIKVIGDGAGSGICAVGNDAVAVFNGGILQLQNLVLSSTAGNDIVTGPGGQVYVDSGVTFGAAPSGSHMNAGSYGQIFLNTTAYTVSGAAINHYTVQNNGGISTQSNPTITITANLAMTNWATVAFGGSNLTVPGETYSLGGNTVTTSGNRVNVSNAGVVYTAAGNTACLNSYFPGSVNGIQASGGQCN
jgi:hypothetical protein